MKNSGGIRGLLLIGVIAYVAVGLVLHLLAGLPVWASIAIPGFAVGVLTRAAHSRGGSGLNRGQRAR